MGIDKDDWIVGAAAAVGGVAGAAAGGPLGAVAGAGVAGGAAKKYFSSGEEPDEQNEEA